MSEHGSMERMNRGRRSILWFVVALIVGTAAFAAVALSQESPSYDRGPGVVPAELREAGLRYLAGAYEASNMEVYEEGRTTLADWRDLEPGNTSGLRAKRDEERLIYAIVVRGTFTIVGPMTPTGPATGSADGGRIIIDESGDVLSVSLWTEGADRGRGAPFGVQFDGDE